MQYPPPVCTRTYTDVQQHHNRGSLYDSEVVALLTSKNKTKAKSVQNEGQTREKIAGEMTHCSGATVKNHYRKRDTEKRCESVHTSV